MDHSSTCAICGSEPETSFHAVMSCTKARALRFDIRNSWKLPAEKELKFTGPDWVLLILANSSQDTRRNLPLLWWRAWHLRNGIILKGQATVAASVTFLLKFSQETATSFTTEIPDQKGKRPIGVTTPAASTKQAVSSSGSGWTAPGDPFLKLNVDDGFVASSEEASWGAVLRNHLGEALLSAWGRLPYCCSAEETELAACIEGLRISRAARTTENILESDCQMMTNALNQVHRNHSHLAAVVHDAKVLMIEPLSCSVAFVSRGNNSVAHALAMKGKTSRCNRLVLEDVPPDVRPLALGDLMPD
ncbi:hypothetical protein BRADI_3g08655v3 [Brachypodium distachyon]|uniref:RNase H type-1 domain-containing protein n=1 Tax=Brachypodium distachyon TaxID=15368 RepID=A0A2K2CW11_BRADI|nr:hypothetical protein BRADI_3g08655v3 [Brachypodium distachyon]